MCGTRNYSVQQHPVTLTCVLINQLIDWLIIIYNNTNPLSPKREQQIKQPTYLLAYLLTKRIKPNKQTKTKVPVKRAFIGAGAEGHPRNSGVAIIGQQLELIGDSEVEVLALVLQHAAQELPGRRVRLERRVQRAAAELAGARPGPRLHNNPAAEKPPAAEIAITGR